jgi:hypothetical protein
MPSNIVGGTANGGNGGEVDNSTATVATAAALTAYAAVEKGVAHQGSRCIKHIGFDAMVT